MLNRLIIQGTNLDWFLSIGEQPWLDSQGIVLGDDQISSLADWHEEAITGAHGT